MLRAANFFPMKPRMLAALCFSLVCLALGGVTRAAAAEKAAVLRALIVDGQNNHAWAVTTPRLKKLLEETGRFTVDVSTTPPARSRAPVLPKEPTEAQRSAHAEKMKTFAADAAAQEAARAPQWTAWRPAFSGYAVVISNYNGEAWPAEVRTAFSDYVRGGGGFVCYHAANNAFPEWPEYNAMIGLGGWGGRNEKSGPYLRLRGAVWTKDGAAGPGGGHGPQHEFVVEAHEADHPILRGLPAKWLHTKDELYHGLRGPAENVTVLASAMSDRTKEREPMLMTIPFGRGRVFHTALGHGTEAVDGLGFQVTFVRGAEWAATGTVTLSTPNAGELKVESAAARPVVRP